MNAHPNSDSRERTPSDGTVRVAASPADLRGLSQKEFLRLARHAAESSRDRLCAVLCNVPLEDQPIWRFLEELILGLARQASSIEKMEDAAPKTLTRHFDERIVDQTLKGYFTSHQHGFGEGLLDRDVAMYFAEVAEGELARFLCFLSYNAPDESLRLLLKGLADDAEEEHEHVRMAIL